MLAYKKYDWGAYNQFMKNMTKIQNILTKYTKVVKYDQDTKAYKIWST